MAQETRDPYRVERLGPGDAARARRLFSLFAEVFETDDTPLSDVYLDALLARRETWIVAAYRGETVVGGATAHELPMTRSESRELFIYDVAVLPEHQRRGVGRRLLAFLREHGGVEALFVPAENEDTHALEFYRAVGGVPSPVTFFTFDPS